MAGLAGTGAALSDCVAHTLSFAYPAKPVLAAGAWFKNTLCAVTDGKAFISEPAGDLDTPDSCRKHEWIVRALLEMMGEKPVVIAHDLHPDFHSTRFAARLAQELDVSLAGVQHHHAHIAAICAEHGIMEPVLGLALDGVGLGTDGQAWGGELLRVDGAGFERIGHLSPLQLPGGDHAAREPWRMAAAALFRMGRKDEIVRRFPGQPGAQTIVQMLERNLNSPPASSMGRLFDAAAGLLGVCEVQAFEAEAPILLQDMAESHGAVASLVDGYSISADGVLYFLPLLAALADCGDAAYGAALFHVTVAAGLNEWVRHAAERQGIRHVVLGGGCFRNAILLQSLMDMLSAHGMQVLTARQLQPDDTAISLGQAWVAMQQIH